MVVEVIRLHSGTCLLGVRVCVCVCVCGGGGASFQHFLCSKVGHNNVKS